MKLWIDDVAEPPDGWRRARTLPEVETALRSSRVREISLGGSGLLVETVAQSLEQGAFTARVPPLTVALRGDHPAAARSLDNARRHWSAMPPQSPSSPPPPRKKRNVLLHIVIWHALGFAVVFAAAEAWSLWRHGHHADIIERFLH